MYVKAQLLVENSGNHLSKQDVSRINLQRPDMIELMFQLCAQVHPATVTPTEILNKVWSGKVFFRCLQTAGALSVDSSINLTKWFAYVLVWNSDGIALGVRHINGVTASFPGGVKVTNEYSVIDPFDKVAA